MFDLDTFRTFAPDPTDPLNLFHERALRDARLASEYRHLMEGRPRGAGVIARVRGLFAAPAMPMTQTCSCPA